ncbi:PEP-CTERM sorting domain-containing protein [Nostoc sp.]|uniref:PEP-CTERM sorting domain-containing protein n=1 Tax=Nostoc sp. TaxID=1180 RepID=UPI002FFA082E
MIGFKSTLLNATLAITAALPLATAGLFTSAGSAQAATLDGGFNFSSAGFPSTTATLSNTFLKFSSSPGLASLGSPSGSFAAFTAAQIFDVNTSTLTPSGSLFLDLGTYGSTFNSGGDTFSLTSFLTPTFSSQNGGTDINVGFNGFFNDGSGNHTNATGYITFSTRDTNALEDYNNQGIKGATFTGFAVTAVPEPATVLGLGLVAAGMFMSRRRKSVVQ